MTESAGQRLADLIRRRRAMIGGAIVLAILALALTLLHRMLAGLHMRDVRAAIGAIGASDVLMAVGLAAGSYLALTLYDVLALRVARKPLPYRTAATASFLSYALSHNLGMATVTGTSVRMHVYGRAGLSVGDVARVQANAGLGFSLGLSLISGVGLLWRGDSLSLASHVLGPATLHLIGGALLAGLCALLIATAFVRRLDLFGWHLTLPSPGQAILQMLVSATDLGFAAATLYVLLPDSAMASYPAFLAAYGIAIAASVASHSPGGLGVFEAVMLAGLSHGDRAGLAAALLMYRGIYYLLPLATAALLAAGREGWQSRQPILRALGEAQSVSHAVAPALLSALTFAGGLILLISGALPAIRSRLRLLGDVVPLPFVEASHIASSLVGTLLLVLAAGLYRRLDGAFLMARALLIAGILFSLLKGLDYEEALALLAIVALLQWTRGAFYRRTALSGDLLSPAWLVAVASAIGTSWAIALFAHKHVQYSNDLWWHFALHGDAARVLRAELAVGILSMALLLHYLMAPRRLHADQMPSPALFDRALKFAERTDAMLAFTGDKRFLAAEEGGDAFLAYQIQGRSWIAMGNPVGNPERWADLMWDFRDRADAEQGRVLFYQLGIDSLPIAIDMGLMLMKYGEEAAVDLGGFALDGPHAKSLRYALRKAEAAGASFEIVRAPSPTEIAALKSISDMWLSHKGRSEKAFSLGRFDEAYLSRFDCAIIRQDGSPVAFANIWATPNRAELSVDLMRHVDDLEFSAMDFLLTKLMLWGKDRGYRTFSLGMAPLAGLEVRRLAPIWAHAGNLLYHRGETLYGFEGLRSYKDKFAPSWTPRYIAANNNISMVRGLVDLNALISGKRTSAASAARASVALPARLYFPADDKAGDFDAESCQEDSKGDEGGPALQPRSSADIA